MSNGKNKVSAINPWVVAVLRYGARVSEWWKQELILMGIKSRKWMTMRGALHLKSNIYEIYLPRPNGGRGLINV